VTNELVLLVDDEPSILQLAHMYLERDGFRIQEAKDGEAALEAIARLQPALVVLDVMLPKLDGFEVCRRVRAEDKSVAILMLTARDEDIDKILGLELGADDYITKPFSLRELLARVKAVLRRTERGSAGGSRVRLGSFEADIDLYDATRDGVEVAMTPKEFEVLKFLWQHRNHTVSRDQLLTNVWGYDESVSTRTVDNFILKLRQKIEEDPADPRYIVTIHGTGYKLLI